jgi:hypothetical protein
MRQHARILGLCSAVLALGVATATSVNAAATSPGTSKVAKPAGYSIATSASLALPAGQQTFGSVICPVKKGVQTVPLSGGALIDTSDVRAAINSSYPTTDGWDIRANNGSPNASAFTVYAVCAKKPSGYVQKESVSVSNPAGAYAGAGYLCPKGDVLTGGGAISSAGDTLVNLNSAWPIGTTEWYVYMGNDSTLNETFNVFRICAKFNVAKTEYQNVAGTTVVNPAAHDTNVSAFCPGGLSTIAGGEVSSGGVGVTINTTFPFVGGWGVDVNNATGASNNVTPYVLCAS